MAGSSQATLRYAIIAFGTAGEAVYCDGEEGAAGLVCCDIFGNAGGDWFDCIEDQQGIENDLSVHPEFCGMHADNPYALQDDSPCAPDNNACGVLIGAVPVDCLASGVTERSWSRIKAGRDAD